MTPPPTPVPVHRPEDGELVGQLSAGRRDGADVWVAQTLFGTELGTFPDPDQAAAFLHARGLALLADRWWWSSPAEGWVPVTLVEARPNAVTIRPGPDPATPLVTLTGAGLAALARTPPA
ncbi:hypothetical protein [Blastococcus sp. SYSU D00695]